MLTAHDFPSAHAADQAGMDIILVGDSLAMVALGMEDTSEVVLEEMILHSRALKVLQDARAVQKAGAFGVVLEAVPAEVAELVTEKLRIPTIGIGAGVSCSGQVLVQVDMLGNYPPGRFLPKFAKKFGDVWGEATRAIEAYKSEVKGRSYPAPEHTYPMPKEEVAEFQRVVEEMEKASGSS